MSERQSDFFFSMLEHAIVPVRATEFAEVETGLNTLRGGLCYELNCHSLFKLNYFPEFVDIC